MAIWRSLSKSVRLRPLSYKLATMPPSDQCHELLTWRSARDAARAKLLDLCESDLTVQDVMRRYRISHETLG